MECDLLVRPFDWIINDKYGDEVEHVHVHCWAWDRHTTPHLLRIINFPAFAHIELPVLVRGQEYEWTSSRVHVFMEGLKRFLGDRAPYRYDFVQRKHLYYYQGSRQYPMIRAQWTTLEAMRRASYALREPLITEDWGHIQCVMWELDITIVRKLLTMQDLGYAQWFTCKALKVEEDSRISNTEHEYIVLWHTMTAAPDEQVQDIVLNPGIASFDIECYSHNHRAMPDKFDARDVAYMISCDYKKYKVPGTMKRYGIVIGDCAHIPPEKLADTTLMTVKDEYDMVLAWAWVINTTDPDIITGYNIFMFDFDYLNHRLEKEMHSWPAMGRIPGQPLVMNLKTWESRQYGPQTMYVPIMEGRIPVDMLPIIRRDYKLDRYDLNTVCKHFLNKTKHDISARRMFEIYEQMQKATTAVHQANTGVDPSVPVPDLESCKKAIETLAQVPPSDPEYEQKQASKRYYEFTVRRYVSYAQYEEAKADMATVMAYCIQDAELVLLLMEKNNTVETLLELSSIMGVTLIELFTRGQTLRCTSQLYDIASKNGYVLTTRPKVAKRGYSGGAVFTPIPGKYNNVICLDFASLYPSITQAYNLCYTTLIPPQLMDIIPDEDCWVVQFEQEEPLEEVTTSKGADVGEGFVIEESKEDKLDDTKPGRKKKVQMVNVQYKYKWYKKAEGLVPKLVRLLVAKRRAVIRSMRGTKGSLKASLQAKQLGLKISANSWSGCYGSDSRYSLIEGARTICGTGRRLNGEVNKYCEEKYQGKVVYGDTDSSMVILNVGNRKEGNYWGIRLAQEISGVTKTVYNEKGEHIGGDLQPDGVTPYLEDRPGLFPPPLKIEFEKMMDMVSFKKKKYAALQIDKKGNYVMKPLRDAEGNEIGKSDEFDLLIKGIAPVRRETIKLVSENYMKILLMVLLDMPFIEALDILVGVVTDLVEGRVPLDKLIFIRALGGNYKSENYYMKIFADNLKRDGKDIHPGDRLDFAITTNPNSVRLGDKARLKEQILEAIDDGKPYTIDVDYYLEKALMNPFNQLFSVGFQGIIKILNEYIHFKSPRKRKPVYLDNVMGLIIQLKAQGYPPKTLSDWVRHVMVKLATPAPNVILHIVEEKEEKKEIESV